MNKHLIRRYCDPGLCFQLPNYVEEAVNLLQTQNKLLACHPNSNLYTHVAQYVELDGFYLESEPCLVCNNPEVPFTSVKLSTIKVSYFIIMILSTYL